VYLDKAQRDKLDAEMHKLDWMWREAGGVPKCSVHLKVEGHVHKCFLASGHGSRGGWVGIYKPDRTHICGECSFMWDYPRNPELPWHTKKEFSDKMRGLVGR
jgi:hypothetical protein